MMTDYRAAAGRCSAVDGADVSATTRRVLLLHALRDAQSRARRALDAWVQADDALAAIVAIYALDATADDALEALRELQKSLRPYGPMQTEVATPLQRYRRQRLCDVALHELALLERLVVRWRIEFHGG